MTACEGGGGMLEERRAERADVAGEIGAVEDVERRDAGREKLCFVACVCGETKVVIVEEVERGDTAGWEGVASDAGGAGVAEPGVEVVVASGFGIGRAGVESCDDTEREPVIGVDVAYEIEALTTIEIGATPFVIGFVLILRKGIDTAGVVFEAGEGVLSLTREPASSLAAEGEVEGAEKIATSGLDLLNLTVVEIGAWVVGGENRVGWQDGGIGVAGAEGLYSDLATIGCGDGDGLVDLAFHADAVLDRVGRADVGVKADEVGGDVVKVEARRDGEGRILDLDGVEDDTVVELDGSGKVAAGAVVEEAGASAEDGLAFARGVGERDAGREVIVVGQEGLPVVTQAERDLELRGELDLILDEGAQLIDPVESASEALLRSEDVGRVCGVVGEGGKFEGAETIGVVVDSAAAELWKLNADADVVHPVAPSEDLVDVDGVFRSCDVGLSAASDERAADLDRLRVGDGLDDVLILLQGYEELVDEIGSEDKAIVEDDVVFAGVEVIAGLGEGNATDSGVDAGGVLEVVADG